jgi:hypothetical protein
MRTTIKIFTEMGQNEPPREGFITPEIGDAIIVMKDFKTGAATPEHQWLRTGESGVVTDIYRPEENLGFTGLAAQFDRISGSMKGGLLFFWPAASDPERFQYRKAPVPKP